MDEQTRETILNRWQSDPAFRQDVRANPEAALEGIGVTLDESQKAALSNVPWDLSDDELSDWAKKHPVLGVW